MVDNIRLFGLATQQANWLSIRQTAIAGNVANANTPGYKTQDIKAFSEVLNSTSMPVGMTATNARHIIAYSDAGLPQELLNHNGDNSLELTHSGNNVSIEDEIRKGSEVARNMSMNTALVKSFQQMLLSVVKH